MNFLSQPPEPEFPLGRRCMVQMFGEAPAYYDGGPTSIDWHYCQNKTEHPAPTALGFPICDSCWKAVR